MFGIFSENSTRCFVLVNFWLNLRNCYKRQHVSTNTMRRQQTEDIIKFLKDNIEPLEDNAYGLGYRASVYLTDGTFLPCVIFRNSKTVVNLAIRRFKEEQTGKGIFNRSSGLGYYNIVKTFVTSGNCINDYDIDRVEKSKFAFPLNIQRQIQGKPRRGPRLYVVLYQGLLHRVVGVPCRERCH